MVMHGFVLVSYSLKSIFKYSRKCIPPPDDDVTKNDVVTNDDVTNDDIDDVAHYDDYYPSHTISNTRDIVRTQEKWNKKSKSMCLGPSSILHAFEDQLIHYKVGDNQGLITVQRI